MKKLIYLLVIVLVVVASCKKDNTTTPTTNSNYNFTVTNAKQSFVILTTATWCHFCWEWGIPTFEGAFQGLYSIDTTKLNGLSLHFDSSDPLFLQMASDIKDQFGIGGPPNLWVEFDNTNNLNPTGWEAEVKTKQTGTSSCGVNLKKVLSGNTYTVYVEAKFFSTLSGTYNLAVYAIENGIVKDQTTDTGDDPNYVHNRVLRGEITSNSKWGKQIFTGTSSSDYKYQFTYTPATGVNIKNVSFVAVIYKMDTTGNPTESTNSNTK